MIEAESNCIAGASDKSVDGIAFFEEQFGEVRAVLAGDAGYECGFGQCFVGALWGW